MFIKSSKCQKRHALFWETYLKYYEFEFWTPESPDLDSCLCNDQFLLFFLTSISFFFYQEKIFVSLTWEKKFESKDQFIKYSLIFRDYYNNTSLHFKDIFLIFRNAGVPKQFCYWHSPLSPNSLHDLPVLQRTAQSSQVRNLQTSKASREMCKPPGTRTEFKGKQPPHSQASMLSGK